MVGWKGRDEHVRHPSPCPPSFRYGKPIATAWKHSPSYELHTSLQRQHCHPRPSFPPTLPRENRPETNTVLSCAIAVYASLFVDTISFLSLSLSLPSPPPPFLFPFLSFLLSIHPSLFLLYPSPADCTKAICQTQVILCHIHVWVDVWGDGAWGMEVSRCEAISLLSRR